jgi:hypothetical protein
MTLKALWRSFKERVLPPRKVFAFEGDALPATLPRRGLVVWSDAGEAWSVAMNCPCGCGQRVELPLLLEVCPRWNLTVDSRGRPTLHPSVALREGCRSHYYVRAGRILWV